jgi:hypothetical protein
MPEVANSTPEDILDKEEIKALLEGGQIQMLKEFSLSKNKEQINNLGSIYYLFSIYWPKELAEELSSQSAEPDRKVEPAQLIEENKPLKYFSSGEFDWNGIKNTINILDNVRNRVNKENKSQ